MSKKFRLNKLARGPASWLRPRTWRRKKVKTALIAAGFVLAATVVLYQGAKPTPIHPSAYGPLLETIAKGESHGNYNAYYGHADNQDVRFTEMSIDQVMKWQEQYVQGGSPSSAVGKYQIVRHTLAGLVKQLHIDPGQPFDTAMQDRMAIALIERRGAQAYVDNKITREQFAANLAKEWAALPKVTGPNPTESHYQGDGLNKSNISITEINAALTKLQD